MKSLKPEDLEQANCKGQRRAETASNLRIIPGSFLAAIVTVKGESISVEPENIHFAITALGGPLAPGKRIAAEIEFEVMTDDQFNAIPNL